MVWKIWNSTSMIVRLRYGGFHIAAKPDFGITGSAAAGAGNARPY
jgi:hypothetical protein